MSQIAASFHATAPRRVSAPGLGLWLILGGLTLARLWAAAVIPLSEDEAYYRLWALSPQFGYYDHPPMIAWWIHVGMTVAGDTPLGVRLMPCLSCLATSLMVFDLAVRLGWDARVAGRAAIWTNATLLIGAGGLLAIPDAACVPFWTLTLWCLARTRATSGEDGGASPWWAAAGLAAGLACLSKYSALFLAPGVVLWLVTQPGGLAALKRPWPWIAVLIAASVFSLNIAWNAGHHWVSFVKQFGRAAPGRFAPRFELELILGQVLLLNPFIAVFAARALTRLRDRRQDLSLVVVTAAPFLAYLLIHALHDRVQAHWPAPIYPGLALAAAAASASADKGWLKALRALAAPFGIGVAVLVLGHAALPVTDLKTKADPVAQLRGWPEFAVRIEAERHAHRAAWVGAVSYGVTAQLAAQAAIQAPVLQLIERDRYVMLSDTHPADPSRPGLVVDLQRRLTFRGLSDCFQSVQPLPDQVRGRGLDANSRYALFMVSGPKRDLIRDGCPGAP